jgi:hypothetical protein
MPHRVAAHAAQVPVTMGTPAWPAATISASALSKLVAIR